MLPAGAAVMVKLNGADCVKLPWLRIDTFTSEASGQRIDISFTGGGVFAATTARVKLGRDTLSVPLSVIVPPRPTGWPDATITLSLRNAGDSPLIMDNVRLSPADKGPPETLLLDFGPGGQAVWPGFDGVTGDDEHLLWAEGPRLRRASKPYPDPLGGDFFGPLVPRRSTERFDIIAPGRKSAVAWLWVTFNGLYGSRSPDRLLKFQGRTLLQHRSTLQGLLGPDGLMAGADGKWTPEWFDSKFMEQFGRSFELLLKPGRNSVSSFGCQVAALVMAPVSQKKALAKFVDTLQKDISTYRRQFMFGYRRRLRCDLNPTDQEKKSGLMVFQPPPDGALRADWTPAAGDRKQTIRVIVPNGGAAIVPLVVVPTHRSSSLRAFVSSLRKEGGRTITAQAAHMKVRFAQRVARRRRAEVEFQPWILLDRHGPVTEKSVVHLAVSMRLGRDVDPGIYSGTIRLSGSSGSVRVPLEVEVVDVGEEAKSSPIVGTTGNSTINVVYRALYQKMSPAQRNAVTVKIRRLLLDNGLTNLLIQAPRFRRGMGVNDSVLQEDLRRYPRDRTPGTLILDMYWPFWNLAENNIPPESPAYRAAMRRLVARAKLLTEQDEASGNMFYVGWCTTGAGLSNVSRKAATVATAGGETLTAVYLSVLENISPRKFDRLLAPFHNFIVTPAGKGYREMFLRLKKTGRGRKVFVYVGQPDRYLSGFFARAVGADGCFVGGIARRSGPYDGENFNGSGLFAIIPSGDFAATVASLRLQQGVEDYILLARAQAMLKKAVDAKKPDAAEKLAAVIKDISSQAVSGASLHFDNGTLRTYSVTHGRMEAWRQSLIREMGALAASLKAP